MMKLREHCIQLKVEKCTFYASKFEFLGYVTTENGMKANPKKIEVIKSFPRSTTVKAVQFC